jgi:hypothetical protein
MGDLPLPSDPVRREKRTKEVIVALLLDCILAVAPAMTPMRVAYRWSVWWLCFTVFVFLILIAIPSANKIRLSRRELITITLSLAFAGAFWPTIHTQWREEMADALDGEIFGGPFEPESNCVALSVEVGTSSSILMMLPPKPGQNMPPYFAPFEDAKFLIECGKRGTLITTTVRDRSGNLVVDIERNHWKVYPPYCSDKNYTKSAIEVKDNSGHVLLQLKFAEGNRTTPPRIQVQGEWWNDEGKGLRIVKGADGHGYVVRLVPQNQHNEALIREIFQYPSHYHWGEFGGS